MEAPLHEIVANASEEPSAVPSKVAEGKGNYGYDVPTGQH
jgi:chaperonin GroEL